MMESSMKELDLDFTVELCYNDPDECEVIMGGDSSNPTWDEYLKKFENLEFQKRIYLIRYVIEENGLVGITGERKQDLGISFKFSDGVHLSFTWRAWGDLMQAIVNKREGYVEYYM